MIKSQKFLKKKEEKKKDTKTKVGENSVLGLKAALRPEPNEKTLAWLRTVVVVVKWSERTMNCTVPTAFSIIEHY